MVSNCFQFVFLFWILDEKKIVDVGASLLGDVIIHISSCLLLLMLLILYY